jgi:hypothetical protein
VILPILAKAFVTTKMMKSDGNVNNPEASGGGFIQTLKHKLAKFL